MTLEQILVPVLSAAFAAGGAFWATKVELRFLWRDLAKLDARVAQLEVESPHPRATGGVRRQLD